MYIDKIFDENIGPIEKISIDFPFKEDGLPKPIIFVGENGSGKSTILSNVIDSLYSIAAKKFDNAMHLSDRGNGQQYYKAITPAEIQTGKEYMYSYILFNQPSAIQYVFKSGKLSTADFKSKIPNGNTITFNWNAEENFKNVKVQEVDVENIFSKDIICYFGPDRYEKPMWMGNKYFDEALHPSVQVNWAGVLKNPITIKNVTETNLQWLMDIIVDSRPDVEGDTGNLHIINVNVPVLLTMRTARQNLETILSQILGKNVYFSLNFRNRGASRFKIVEQGTNKVVAPTLDSLSTGQIALFNMFSTIVRYADNNDLNKSIALSEISGIVVIDEIELHLHTSLQKEVLPKLIKLFPKVQFIITSHAPLFLLGMQKEFGEEGYEVYEMPAATKISVERFSEFQRAYEYFKETQTYQKDAESAIEAAKSSLSSKVLIITEGATDWKHMKTAFSVLKQKEEYADLFNGLDFDFFEYEPANSKDEAVYKLEMGNTTLTSICENYAKMPQETRYIFVADCDVPTTNKKMGNADGQYKKWAENVFSFTIPVPDHRKETPDISIEHLFTDLEIKKEIVCDDGISRRLYMGNEFDQYGHAQSIDRFCERKDICGPNKINVIEGTQGDKIHCFSDSSIENYALPKMKFAKYVCEHPDEFDFSGFVEVFKVIKEIIQDGVVICLNNHQL